MTPASHRRRGRGRWLGGLPTGPSLAALRAAPVVVALAVAPPAVANLARDALGWVAPALACLALLSGGAYLFRCLARRSRRFWPAAVRLGLAYALLQAGLLEW